MPKKTASKPKKRVSNKSTGRNYRDEYDNYQGKKEQIERRSSRNTARAAMAKAGKVKKGDGKDVDHKNGRPKDNKKANLKAVPKSKNRSYARTKTAGKKNAKS